MGLTSSRGNRPARLHSSIIGIRLSSMNWRVVSRTSRSSSVSRESYWMKSTPRNLMAGMRDLRGYEVAQAGRNQEPAHAETARFAAHRIGRVQVSKHMTLEGGGK